MVTEHINDRLGPGGLSSVAVFSEDASGNTVLSGVVQVELIPSTYSDLVTARANSVAVHNAVNSGLGRNVVVRLFSNSPGTVYLAPTAIATLNASGLTTPYAFMIPSDVTIECADEMVIGKAFSDDYNTSINSMGLFGINSKHNAASVVVNSATHELGFTLGSGNQGYPRLVTFNCAVAPALSAGESFQIIGELGNSRYNEEHWVAASVTGTTVTAYTNVPVGTFLANENTKLIPCNRGITIRGGKWDGGAIYNHLSGSAVYGCGFLFNKVNDVFLDNVTVQNGPQYGVMYCNIRAMRVHNFTNDGYANGLWGAAPFFNIDVDGFQSTSVDDSFATVGDHDNGYSSAYAYGDITLWDMATSENPLPRRGITIRNAILHGHGRIALYSGPGELSGIVLDNVTTNSPITFSGLASVSAFPAWAPNTAYLVDNKVKLNNKIYHCRIGGTSAGSGGPSGRSDTIVDGTVTWAYHSSLCPNNQVNDATLRNIKFVTRKGWPGYDGSDPAVGHSSFIWPGNGNEVVTIDSLLCENITIDNSQVCSYALLIAASGVTINNLTIRNLKYKNNTAFSIISAYQAGDGNNNVATVGKINNLLVDGGSVVMDLSAVTNNVGYFTAMQSGGSWKISNMELSNVSSGAYTATFANSSQGYLDSIEFENCKLQIAAPTVLTGGSIRQTVVNGGRMVASSAGGTDRAFSLGVTGGDYVFNDVVTGPLTDGTQIHVGASLNSIVLNNCQFDFKAATTSNGVGLRLADGITVQLIEVKGCKFGASDRISGVFTAIRSDGATLGRFDQLNVTGGILRDGGNLLDNVADNLSINVDGMYLVNANSLVSHGGHMKVRVNNVATSGSLGSGGLLNTWGSGQTWSVSSVGCDLGSNPLGVNGSNNALRLAVYGWIGSGTYATWGTTPTVSALGKY